MHGVPHASLHPSHSTLLSRASKHITCSFNGERTSSLSVIVNGLTLRGILAHNHISTMTVFTRVIAKARKRWFSRLNSLLCSSSFQILNGKSLKHFERSASLPRPLVRKEYPSLCPLHLYYQTTSSLPHPFVHKPCLSLAPPLPLLSLDPLQFQYHALRFFFPRDRQLPQHQVASLSDQSRMISCVYRTTM